MYSVKIQIHLYVSVKDEYDYMYLPECVEFKYIYMFQLKMNM